MLTRTVFVYVLCLAAFSSNYVYADDIFVDDADGDGIVDAFDHTPYGDDTDGDGIADMLDDDPYGDLDSTIEFDDVPDSDGDGILDPWDLFPDDPDNGIHGCAGIAC